MAITPNHATAQTRRFIFWLAPSLWIGVMLAAFSAAATVPDDVAEDEPDEIADVEYDLATARLEAAATIDELKSRSARQRLDELPLKKIAIVNQVCELTDAQKQKLALAGLGDKKRLLDRVTRIENEFQLLGDDRDEVVTLFQNAQVLRQGFVGVSNVDSLFIKVLDQIITSDQRATYLPLKAVIRAGGMVQNVPQGSDEVLVVVLDGIRFPTDGMALLSKLPNVHSLHLDSTRGADAVLAQLNGLSKLKYLSLCNSDVTDAGLSHLTKMVSLHEIQLRNTLVTDVGLAHLKSLTELKRLVLYKTQVSGVGIAELQHELPGLAVNK